MAMTGIYLAACLLLVAAGVAKAWRPADTARGLAGTVRLPVAVLRPLVRAGAAAEAVLGVVGLVRPGPLTAGLVAASYAAFAVFVAAVLVRGGPLASCGCFSRPDTPATRLHVVVDLVLAAAAAAVALDAPSGTLGSLLAGQPWHGVPLVLLGALCAYLAYLALAVLPLVGATRLRLGITRGEAG